MKKLSFLLWPFTFFLGCRQSSSFYLEPPDYRNLVHAETGLYVHREVELKVNANRLSTLPESASPGYESYLDVTAFFPLGAKSAGFIRDQYEQVGPDRVWKEVTHLSKDDYKGKTSFGACITWDKEGEVRIKDISEIFDFPKPEINQLDQWSPWVKASRSRQGVFAWHAEANQHDPEEVIAPEFPFEMRFRLVLSKRMYP